MVSQIKQMSSVSSMTKNLSQKMRFVCVGTVYFAASGPLKILNSNGTAKWLLYITLLYPLFKLYDPTP